MKTKNSHSILKTVHETARDLHEIGFIDKKKMQQYDVLCLEPVPEYDGSKIKKIRDRYHISQAVLAAMLNTSLSTVRQWEIDAKSPSGPSSKLLSILEKKGFEALI